MSRDDKIQRARKLFEAKAWRLAREEYRAADQESPLEAGDLDRLAQASYLSGNDEESVTFWARAYQEFQNAGEIRSASRCAFWLGFGLMIRGEMARARGWLGRGERILGREGGECPERGLLLLPAAYERMLSGDVKGSLELNLEAAEIGERFGDPDVTTLASLGLAEGWIADGEVRRGVGLLDELMVAVGNHEVNQMTSGILYCAAILACREISDVGRAAEWTQTLSRLCDSQPELVQYRGVCQLHRAEIMTLRGEWRDAQGEIELACRRLAGDPAVSAAYYLQAELHRRRGEFEAAEEAYRRTSLSGREPQPGLSLLRLAQGNIEAAASAIRRVLDEAHGPLSRSKVLGAFGEIMVAAGNKTAAREAAEELDDISAALGTPYLRAQAAQLRGSVELVEGDAGSACESIRRAWVLWHQLEARHDAARARLLFGLACRALGDEDTAEMELDAARTAFAQLGATHDLSEAERLSGRLPGPVKGLSMREVEVLVLVAAGRSNRQIASALFISERTVARHLQNIFAKLGVTSRTAASAFAYRHNLV